MCLLLNILNKKLVTILEFIGRMIRHKAGSLSYRWPSARHLCETMRVLSTIVSLGLWGSFDAQQVAQVARQVKRRIPKALYHAAYILPWDKQTCASAGADLFPEPKNFALLFKEWEQQQPIGHKKQDIHPLLQAFIGRVLTFDFFLLTKQIKILPQTSGFMNVRRKLLNGLPSVLHLRNSKWIR